MSRRETRESVFAPPAELAAIVARVNAEKEAASHDWSDSERSDDAEGWKQSRYSMAAAYELNDARREADLARLRAEDLEHELKELSR